MTSMIAYLDDFGKFTVWVNSNFYSGKADSFQLIDDLGYCEDLPVRQVEKIHNGTNYYLSGPKEIEFGRDYKVRENHGLAVPVEYRMIVKTDEFNLRYFYDKDDLGSVYTPESTSFAVWAPTAVGVILRVRMDGKTSAWPMERTEKGVYRKTITGDLKNASYVYLVERNGKIATCTDPYAYSSFTNGRESAVIDLSKVTAVAKASPRNFVSGTDAIIYEVSVRDATSSKVTGTKEHGTFNAFVEENTKYGELPTGLAHILSLGVTHVQLLPVMDFTTVNECHPTKSYNWGYDPGHYLVPEGSYSSDPENPYARMTELRRMISVLHSHDVRVNLDVVFNHMYDSDGNCFQSIIPYYYFRYHKNGNPSNGSFCGNDFASELPMARGYIVHVIRKMIELYDIDGLRFDLMGILDTTTMNTIRDICIKIKPGMMIYGEGWDLPTSLEWEKKAQISAQQRMPHIGHFNDYFRDTIKGKTGDDQRYLKGYATGDLGQSFDACSALTGNVLSQPYYKRFETPDQSINALETHDNNTIWDKMHYCNGNEDRETRRRRQRLMIGMTMVAQGVPFLHAGIEFCGTKNDNPNSYNAGDEINQLDWERALFNKDTIEYTRKAVTLRKKYWGFRMKNADDIRKYVRTQTLDNGVIFYDVTLPDPESSIHEVRVILNSSYDDKWYRFDGQNYKVLFNENGDRTEGTGDFCAPRLSMIVLYR